MSPFFHTLVLALIAALLTGCVGGTGTGSPRAAPVLAGTLSVGIPAGYCIDKAASREARDSAVLILGRCADNVRAVPAVITLSVGESGSAGAMAAGGAALAEFFTSSAGRASLSRDGRPAEVMVLQALSTGDAFILRLRDKRAGEYWRAVLGVSTRLVTVSVTGTPALPLAPDQGREVLDATLDAMRKANAS